VEDCGYSLASAGQLVGDDTTNGARVWCEPLDESEEATDYDGNRETDTTHPVHGNWQLVVSEYTPPYRERLRTRLSTLNAPQVITTLAVGGGFLLLPLLFPISVFWIAVEDDPPMWFSP
jgi:hypothetical protein